jgi:LPS-assembly lipoprotein
MAVSAVGLGGCGFALRQAPKFAFASVRFRGAMGSASRALQRELGSSGIQVARPAADGSAAQVVLTVLIDRRERVVVGKLANGQVRELQLRYRFRFSLSTPGGKTLLDEDEILLERDISFSETAVLAKAAEEQTMFNDMQGDVVQQVMRRLASVKSV